MLTAQSRCKHATREDIRPAWKHDPFTEQWRGAFRRRYHAGFVFREPVVG